MFEECIFDATSFLDVLHIHMSVQSIDNSRITVLVNKQNKHVWVQKLFYPFFPFALLYPLSLLGK